ncbi:MAG: phosphosulfolactate synthase [Bacteroidota bacterium]|nr:phosphosulfolactate synthase [Bacteroidota bacterium]
MNFSLPYLPLREAKPRKSGLTMMMDKGLSLREVENFCDAASDFTDIVKFGFGTAFVTNNLKEKINIYRQANIRTYFGGTLFELFIIRGMFDEFRKLVDSFGLEMVEISDGSMNIPHKEKLEYIRTLSQQHIVVSEVGYKVSGVMIPTEKWVEMMQTELEAGAWKVIAEARESGNVGIYNSDGSANAELVCDIIQTIDKDSVLWEAPNKSQQAYFIKLLGANVSLGNIAPHEVVSLETLRLGLRGDTFFDFLPEELLSKKLK